MFDDPTIIRLDEPADFAYLIGYHPQNSLITVALRDGRLISTLRIDLPLTPAAEDRFPAAMDDLSRRLTRSQATDSILIGYGAEAPVTDAITRAATAAAAAGATPRHRLRVTDGFLYTDVGDPDAPDPIPFDPNTTIAAAAATVAGYVALPDRASIAAQLAPLTGAARTAFTAATSRAVDHIEAFLASINVPEYTDPAVTDQPATATVSDQQVRAVTAWADHVMTEAMTVYRAGQSLDDDRAAVLTIVLALGPLWDRALRRSSGEHWQIRMWTDLLRRAEPSLAGGPANLLTMAALQAGNAALAACAVQRALDCDPADELARLLVQLITIGIHPHEATALTRA